MHLAVVSQHDRLDDRQSETGPTGPAAAPTLGAPEAIEHPISGVGRQTGPVVANLDHGSITFASKPYLNGGARRGVYHSVTGQVRQYLA
jgi:hypothetical protein